MALRFDVETYPLTRLHSTTASEMGKVLENSYRATTIAQIARATVVKTVLIIPIIRQRHRCGPSIPIG